MNNHFIGLLKVNPDIAAALYILYFDIFRIIIIKEQRFQT